MSARNIPLLVVDDDPAIRRLLRATLSVQGYRVLDSATGNEALEIAARESPEIVLLDLGLPDMDGADVIRRLRGSDFVVQVFFQRGGFAIQRG